MNKYFIKGLLTGTFIGFILTSPKRELWLKQLECKLKRFARKAITHQK
ncbi:hypothetical protein GFS24_16200 [Chitinophaga sp. SYP-B3965]|nr:hypothetical protein [Chitinophaga sp. SYP-B3965]MRG46666.1 hypothetical protein [Chitinophaga sp. SYP-B3965]